MHKLIFNIFLSTCLMLGSAVSVGLCSSLPSVYLLLLKSETYYCAENYTYVVGDVADRMWLRLDDGELRTFTEAESYCRNLDCADNIDWRIPNQQELEGLVDKDPDYPPPYVVVPLYVRSDAAYWTTENSGSSEKLGVDFVDGTTNSYRDGYDGRQRLYTRCVRDVN